ncbi:MAG TPA: FAD-dependent monooxygenase [Chitinophagaceae bacterium]|nr:FAD-dependent monooxygenase [Chitinophagaceae bacterium]
MNRTGVLIVGAGPAGLMLACELARQKVAVRIIDRRPNFPNGSRATGLQPRNPEVLDDLGIAEKILQSGSNEIIFRHCRKNEMGGEAGPDNNNLCTDTKYHHFFFIPQWRVEELLREKLASFGVTVELNTDLENIIQTSKYVVAYMRKNKSVETLHCSNLVGCDGGKSTVRKILNMGFQCESHEDECMRTGDTEIDGLVPDAWHLWLHPQLGMSKALCSLPNTSKWQLQAATIPNEKGIITEPTLENFQQIFQEQSNMSHVQSKNISWQSLYRVNVHMRDKFGIDRIFITGDAAHVHSVTGGLGMNTGIRDAYNLGSKLASVIKNHANKTLMDTYEEERLPVAAWTLNISSERQKVVVSSARPGQGGMESSASKDTNQLTLN